MGLCIYVASDLMPSFHKVKVISGFEASPALQRFFGQAFEFVPLGFRAQGEGMIVRMPH